MKIRFLLAALCAVLFSCSTTHAQGTVYTSWSYYTELANGTYTQNRIRAHARIYNPGWGQTFKPSHGVGSSAQAYVGHMGAGGFRMEATNLAVGLGSTFVTHVHTLSRYDSGINRRYYYSSDAYVSNWYPSQDGPTHYELTRAHPYGTYYYAWVYVSPIGFSHLVDMGTTVTLNNHGYLTKSVEARGIYFVRP